MNRALINCEKRKSSSLFKMGLKDGAIVYGIITLIFILAFIPLVTLLSSSFTSNDMLKKGITIFPRAFTIEAYKYLFLYPQDLIKSYLLTIGVTGVGMIINLGLILLVAYPLSDVDFKYRGVISFIVYFTMLFNAGLIPIYIILRRVLMLYDTFMVLVLVPLCAPGHIFMMRVFLQGIPTSLLESARIDGANEWKILFSIVVPLIKPGIATMLFQFLMMYWNDASTALNFTDTMTPIALYVQRWESFIKYLEMIQTGGIAGGGLISPDIAIPQIAVRFSMGVLSCAPLLLIFTLFQKKFVKGLSEGAIKE